MHCMKTQRLQLIHRIQSELSFYLSPLLERQDCVRCIGADEMALILRFKRTKGMEALLDERTKRSKKGDATDAGDGLENLVASIKRKSKDALEERDRKKRRF